MFWSKVFQTVIFVADMKFDKSRIYPIVLIFAMFVVYKCRESEYNELKKDLVALKGTTMGTTYDIRYFDSENRNFQVSIDSLLNGYNQLFSTYISDSELCKVNEKTSTPIGPLFYEMLVCSNRLYLASDGYYDPTILPLIKRWGFAGVKQDTEPSQVEIDSLLNTVGFDKITFNDTLLTKPKNLQLDFSSIAKGLAVDAVSDLLLSKNILNHKVDIGGELVCKGLKPNEQGWMIGIVRPEKVSNDVIQKVELKDWALATSGNYRNIRSYKNKEYGHTLSPKTGRPEKNQLLSVSIFSDNCMKADAFATACMAGGLNRSIQMIEQNSDIEGYLIYLEEGVEKEYYSTEAKKMMRDE